MSFTYRIKEIDFFIDQYEDKGIIDLDGAIDVFQKFPFDKQLKERSLREMTSSLPTISFINEANCVLEISAKDDKGFHIDYESSEKISHFFLSNDFYENPQGKSPEEFINLFFDGKIEEEIILRLKGNSSQDVEECILKYQFMGKAKLGFYFWTLPYLIFSLLILLSNYGLSLNIVFAFFWLPGTILHISYWLKNKNTIVTIDRKKKNLTYEKMGKEITFNRSEIHYCEINETKSIRAPWNKYRYIWIVLNDKRQVVITNFITEPENIVQDLKLNYSIDKRAVPFLPL